MNLLLTGGTGFFGKALLRHWAETSRQGHATPNVTVLSRQPAAFLSRHPEFARQAWLRFHEGDVLRPSSFPMPATFTHVLHAAADSTLTGMLTPLQRYDQIVDGTRHLLDYAAAHRIRRFLFTSSGGVYGSQPTDMAAIPETYHGIPDPLNEHSAYGIAKRSAEHLCALYGKQHGLEVVIARCFAFVGRDMPLDVHFAIGNFIRDAGHSTDIVVNGDGLPLRSYLDQRDLARWLEKILCRGRAGQAYNVGAERAISILELAHLVRDLLAPTQHVRVLGSPKVCSYRNRYIPCTTKVRVELQLEQLYSLEASILETARHHYSDTISRWPNT
jgi:UDP-glucuronate decarboxylase